MSRAKPTLGEGISIDLDVLVNTRLLIQANSGGGKSWCLRRLLEQTHGRIQHLVIDPEGEFASLRAKFDYVLAAKRDGDTLADPRSAKLLAERLLELGVSAIIDIFELTPENRKRFVMTFLDALVDAPKKLWHPALVVLDEAHVYCPEKGDAESADAVKSMATRGRKRGFCLIPATQRLSKLDKDVAAECNNKLIGRTVLDVDLKRAADELGFTKTDWPRLRDLEAGEFFAFGPALVRTVTKFKVDGVQTEHPKAGAHLAAVPPQPSEKVKSVLAKLSDLPQEAERKAATEAELRGEIQQLKRELKAQPKPQTETVSALTEADRRVLVQINQSFLTATAALSKDGLVTQVQTALTPIFDGYIKAHRESVQALLHGVSRLKPITDKIDVSSRPSFKSPYENRIVSRPAPKVRPVATGIGEALPPGERAVLIASAQYDDGVTRDQLGVLTGYKRSSRDAYIARLTLKGYVDTSRGQVVATESGIAALGADYEPLPTGPDLLDWWRGRLPKGELAVLEVLIAANGQPVPREAIDEATGFKRSSRDAYLARLSSRRLVDSVGRGEVKASEELF